MPPADPNPNDIPGISNAQDPTTGDQQGWDLFKSPDQVFDWNGASAGRERRRQDTAQRNAMQLWGGAQRYAPSAKNLSDPYNYNPDMMGLQDIANSHGLTEGTKSAYQGMQQQTGQQAAAQRGAIQQQMVARGMGQSGLDYAAQLQAGQAGADASAMGGFQAVAQGEQARNSAIGQMAGIRERQQGAYADAQSHGLEQVYQNYMQMAAGATGQYSQNANTAANREAADKQSQGQGLGFLGTLGTAAIMACDERAKHNIRDGAADADRLMDALRPRSFEYIDAAHGEGEHLGVMAQDVESADPLMVVEIAGLKHIDLKRLVVALAATVGRLNERLRALEPPR